MLDAADKAVEFASGLNASTFAADEKTVYAVVRALEIIGEAAKSIPTAVRRAYPAITWRAMAGMRDKLTHEYFGVNRQVVWRTVQDDLPGLRSKLRPIIVELEHRSEGS